MTNETFNTAFDLNEKIIETQECLDNWESQLPKMVNIPSTTQHEVLGGIEEKMMTLLKKEAIKKLKQEIIKLQKQFDEL